MRRELLDSSRAAGRRPRRSPSDRRLMRRGRGSARDMSTRTSIGAGAGAPADASCRRRGSRPTAACGPAHCSVAATAARGSGSTTTPGTTPSTPSRSGSAAGCRAAWPAAISSAGPVDIRSARASPARSTGCARYGPGTSPQSRGVGNTLPGLQRPRGIEHAAHAPHQRQIGVAEHPRHVLRLVRADAVLAGQRAAGIDAVAEDLGRHRLGPLGLPGHLLVVADQRMQVAVAGMEDVADAQARGALRARGCGSAPPAAGCAARRRPARSSSATPAPSRRTPPSVPSRSARAAASVLATSIGGRAAAAADLLDHVEQRPHLGIRPVELDDQHGVGRRKAGMHGRFGGLNRQRVHHLDRGRNDARADDVRDRGAAARRSCRTPPAASAPLRASAESAR